MLVVAPAVLVPRRRTHIDAGRAGAEAADRRVLAREPRRGVRVVAEEAACVLPGDLVNLLVGQSRAGQLRMQQIGRVGPGAVGVRVVALPGDRVDADPFPLLEAGGLADEAAEEVRPPDV